MSVVTCPASGGGTVTYDTGAGTYTCRDEQGQVTEERPLTEAEVLWTERAAQQEADQTQRQALRQALRDFKNLPTPDHSAWTNANHRDIWRAVTDLCRYALDEG